MACNNVAIRAEQNLPPDQKAVKLRGVQKRGDKVGLGKREESLGVGGGGFCDFLERSVSDLRDLFGHRADVGWFIPFSPIPLRRQVGGVGLDEKPREIDGGGGLLKRDRLRKGHDAREREIEAELNRLLRDRAVSGEAVKDPADLGGMGSPSFFL